MRLPNNSIGVSDILQSRECRRRWAFQMRRWTEEGEPPEDRHPDTMYGTIIHDCLRAIEADDLTDEQAVQFAFENYGRYLDPEDEQKLRDDFETYRLRDTLGVRTVGNEVELAVPLLEWCFACEQESAGAICEGCGEETETIYFRGTIDRLYQRIDNPAIFVHRDYKSSKWPKSEEEVHKDIQMWAYNWSIHEFWPECESLTQVYDQLRAGEIPTRKNDAQREQIKAWLKRQVIAILKLPEGEQEPTHNEWCPWCPIMESCSEVKRLSEWSIARIEALRPTSEDGKEEPLDADLIESYVADLEVIERAKKMGERYADSVKGVVKKMPSERRSELGYETFDRKNTTFSPEALERAHGLLGPDFYRVAGMTQTRLKKLVEDEEVLEEIMGMATKTAGATVLKRVSDD